MLEVLLESRGLKTPRPMFEAVVSALAHGALFVALVTGSSMRVRGEPETARQERVTDVEYIVPPDRAGPPQQEQLQFLAAGSKGLDHDASSEGDIPAPSQSAESNDDRTVVAVASNQLKDEAYSVLDVDSGAVRDPSSAAPAYPPEMMNLSIEGAATILFVVDTTGRVDLGTVKTVNSTNPAFAIAVLEALPRMKFRPARLGATPVRQTATEEFRFQLQRSAAPGRP